MDEYFQAHPTAPVTVANIYKAIEARKQDYKWVSVAQARYNIVASENVQAAQELVSWLNTQGKVGQLVGQGDEAYENLRLLLLTLRGYQIDATTISHAIDLFNQSQVLNFISLQAARRTEPSRS